MAAFSVLGLLSQLSAWFACGRLFSRENCQSHRVRGGRLCFKERKDGCQGLIQKGDAPERRLGRVGQVDGGERGKRYRLDGSTHRVGILTFLRSAGARGGCFQPAQPPLDIIILCEKRLRCHGRKGCSDNYRTINLQLNRGECRSFRRSEHCSRNGALRPAQAARSPRLAKDRREN